ncbi:hypothetical protein CRYUN_Cryun26dG0062100 [Craigia yunnanensis]
MAEEKENKHKNLEKPQKQKQKRERERERERRRKRKQRSRSQKQCPNPSEEQPKQETQTSHEAEEDPRVKVLKKKWFEGKDCLDWISVVTAVVYDFVPTSAAKKYKCKSILGLDIDSDLIEDAFWYLRKFKKMESAQKKQANDSGVKAVQEVNRSEQCTTALSNEGTNKGSNQHSSGERDLSDIVSFLRENFVQSRHPPDKYYDTILCLSVTKWIHLNWGDDGLITLFTKIWRLLHPGGIFVFEPQPWESYEKNRKVSETTASNYHSIMFQPERFQEILLDKIGFRSVEDVTSGLSGTRIGFDRPLFVFYK